MIVVKEEYMQLREALLHAPEYFDLPDEKRASCKRFLSLLAVFECKESDYLLALAEAKLLETEGKLTIEDARHVRLRSHLL